MSSKVCNVDSIDQLIAELAREPLPRSAIALIGGADHLAAEDRAAMDRLFEMLVDYLDRTDTAVVDGGTDSGVMRLIGRERANRPSAFRLVGVAPRGALGRRTRDGAEIRLAPGHPEIFLVPGSQFGEETAWLFAAADHLAGGAAPTIVINGGHLTHEEAILRLDADRLVVTVEGSGRAADELAADDGLRGSGRLRVIPLSADEAILRAALGD
jgi:SLOG in TRPM, prokaryote